MLSSMFETRSHQYDSQVFERVTKVSQVQPRLAQVINVCYPWNHMASESKTSTKEVANF